jgi:hypothetical protein
MRFTIFTIFSLLFSPITLSGQEAVESRFKGGLIAGFTLSQIQGDDAAGYNKFGFQAGARVAIVLKEKIDLGVEILFSQRGSAARNVNQGSFPFVLTLNYIEVPVIFNYKDWKPEEEDYYRLHFHTGFSYGRLINFTTEANQFTILGEFFRDNDASWILGATYYVNEHLGITGRYTRSLYPFFVPDENMMTPNASALTSFNLSLHTVYMF